MYCDKPHINQLTALLKKHGFQDIVVCPGSRNGILVHNFDTAQFHLHPVTDERSAAFVALGLCLSTRRPVALCVTSGSALLNTLPAVAEAFYRQIPLLIISADRPKQWIGQLDGQTLAQNNALQPYAITYTIEETENKEVEHWNNLRINEAILALQHNGGQPVHLNVPINEPLFTFQTKSLPTVSFIQEENMEADQPLSPKLIQHIKSARLPIIVMGQYEKGLIPDISDIEKNKVLLFLPEIVAQQKGEWRTTALEHLLPHFDFEPDLVIHIGGNLVNKQLKLHLRRMTFCKVIRIEPTAQTPDTFGHLCTIVRTSPEAALHQLAQIKEEHPAVKRYQQLLDVYQFKGNEYIPSRFSDIGVQQQLYLSMPDDISQHIGNSSVIRNATYFSDRNSIVFCNRGVNGIEGSLSTAVGYAIGHQGLTICLIGDLSFFYDQNALWNKRLPQNLRIILFNNGGGQIFYRLPGLDQTPSLSPYIAAAHHTSAQGIAESYEITYLAAHNYPEVSAGLERLFTTPTKAPILMEVFTQTQDNEFELKQIKQYYKTLIDYGKNME